MTIKEARQIVRKFDDNRKNPSEEDFFIFSEAMDFLISREHNPRDMMNLGGVYYEMRNFDLALKYYEMAAGYDYDPAYECLGYIWYYGRTGTTDYKKAFEYFSKLMKKGNLVASYKVADMYKNGYYVQKNYNEYKNIINKLYPKALKCNNVFDPVPEIFTRLANIKKDEGNTLEAANLLLKAKNWLGQRIHYSSFFGNLNIMKWLIDDLYDIIDFDEEYFDFFDLYYLLKSPHEIIFEYNGQPQRLTSVLEDDEIGVCFNGNWFRGRDEFFKKAVIDGTNIKLTSVANEMYGFTVEK